ncbi:hypothetical protein ACSVDA_05545 [Cytobacillus sp. Hm23]
MGNAYAADNTQQLFTERKVISELKDISLQTSVNLGDMYVSFGKSYLLEKLFTFAKGDSTTLTGCK